MCMDSHWNTMTGEIWTSQQPAIPTTSGFGFAHLARPKQKRCLYHSLYCWGDQITTICEDLWSRNTSASWGAPCSHVRAAACSKLFLLAGASHHSWTSQEYTESNELWWGFVSFTYHFLIQWLQWNSMNTNLIRIDLNSIQFCNSYNSGVGTRFSSCELRGEY